MCLLFTTRTDFTFRSVERNVCVLFAVAVVFGTHILKCVFDAIVAILHGLVALLDCLNSGATINEEKPIRCPYITE
jgi:hypothetical protein